MKLDIVGFLLTERLETLNERLVFEVQGFVLNGRETRRVLLLEHLGEGAQQVTSLVERSVSMELRVSSSSCERNDDDDATDPDPSSTARARLPPTLLLLPLTPLLKVPTVSSPLRIGMWGVNADRRALEPRRGSA